MKKLLTALALATLAASPAFAATKHTHTPPTSQATEKAAAERKRQLATATARIVISKARSAAIPTRTSACS